MTGDPPTELPGPPDMALSGQADMAVPGPPDMARAVHQMALSGHGMVVVLEQAFGRDSLYQLRAAVAAHAAQAGMPPARTQDVVLAVSELVANVIRHGSGQGRLRMWANEQRLHCEVIDAGPHQPVGNAEPPQPPGNAGSQPPGNAGSQPPGNAEPGTDAAAGSPAPWPIQSGHGLWVVTRLADDVSFDAGPPSTAAVSFTFKPAEDAGDAGPGPPE